MADKKFPKYAAYIVECRAMAADIDAEVDKISAKIYADKRLQGLDNPETSVLHKENARRLKEIQKKNGFD